MIENIKGTFPEVKLNSRTALEFLDSYYAELHDGRVYFVCYRIGRITEFGLLSVGSYINRRAQVIESYEDFFERVFTNSKGSLSVKLADTTQEEFTQYYNDIMNSK